MAAATGGAYFPASSSSAVSDAYGAIAEQLRRTWRITYLSAARPGDTVDLKTTFAGFGLHETEVQMPGDASSALVKPGAGSKLIPGFVYENNLGTMLLALLMGSITIIAVGLIMATPGGTRLRRRIEPHTLETRKRRARMGPRDASPPRPECSRRPRSRSRTWASGRSCTARSSGPTSAPDGRVLLHLRRQRLLVRLRVRGRRDIAHGEHPGAARGAFLPVAFLSFKAKRRMNAIEEQLPDILITIAASLKAGHSFRQGLQAVVDEGQPPASDEFKRVLTETSLGRPMDDALAEMSERIGSKNLDFVITAVTIQRQVGGSLAGIFDMVADAVRERQQFMRKIKGLTAMGRMSAYVLIGLPFFLAGMFTLINPQYMAPLWGTSAGHKIIFSGLVMMAIGSLLLKKIVNFKVTA